MPHSRRSDRRSSRRDPDADGRVRYASGTPWEARVGYARAVRVGPRVLVSGTTATGSDGRVVGRGDPYQQTVTTLDNIETALTSLGSSAAAIVRLRIYVTDLSGFDAIAQALGERFHTVRPAMTMVEVRALVDPAMLIEIEVDAEDLPAPGTARPRLRRPLR